MNEHDDERDPLDLPLGRGPEEPPRPEPGGWDVEPGAPAEGDSPPPPPRRRWPLVLLGALALVVLLALAGVVGYLLPRPGPPVLRVDASLLDFGAVRVGETAPAHELTLLSAGERPVRIGDLALAGSAADAFEISSDECSGTSLPPERSCTVALRFSPPQAAALQATLEVPAEASNAPLSVPLTGEGVAPEPMLDRSRIDFSPLPVGSPSGPEVVTLGNRGGAPLAVEGMALEGPAAEEFVIDGDRCTGETLDPGGECRVRVVFAPDVEGERRATLRFRLGGEASDAEATEVALSGAAIGARPGGKEGEAAPAGAAPPPPPELRAEPASLDFGEVPLGADGAAEEVVLRNTGGSPARLAPISLAGPDRASFEVRDDRCSGLELGPGERCTVKAIFRPRQEGVLQARFAFSSPDLPQDATAPQVTVRGAGAVARLVLGAREIDFGEVRRGSSAERRLTLSNAGRAPLEVRDLGLRGEAAPDFTVATNACPETVPLAPGERCEVTLRFAPSAEGKRAAVLVVRHGGAGPAAEVNLTGTGLPAPAPRAEVSPGGVRFGTVAVGGRSDIETVTVTNGGSARLVLREVRIEGRDAGDFQLVPGSCAGATFLVPGSDCTFGVRFVPSGTGERRARLVIPHNAAGGREAVNLSGTGGS